MFFTSFWIKLRRRLAEMDAGVAPRDLPDVSALTLDERMEETQV